MVVRAYLEQLASFPFSITACNRSPSSRAAEWNRQQLGIDASWTCTSISELARASASGPLGTTAVVLAVSVLVLSSCAWSYGTSSTQHFHQPGIALFAVNDHRLSLHGHRFHHDSSDCWGPRWSGPVRSVTSAACASVLGIKEQNTPVVRNSDFWS